MKQSRFPCWVSLRLFCLENFSVSFISQLAPRAEICLGHQMGRPTNWAVRKGGGGGEGKSISVTLTKVEGSWLILQPVTERRP